MNTKRAIRTAVTVGIFGISGGLPYVYADQATEAKVEHKAAHAEQTLKDAWLDGKLETAILFNEHLNSFDIDTEVKNRTAYLSGAVESDIDRDLAEQIAKSVDGIETVQNQLVVDATKARMEHDDDGYKQRHSFKRAVSDATLTARIKTQLLMGDNTSGLAIDVDSDDGVVTLSGKVKSSQEKDLAMKIAENTSGTQSVNNRLVVSAQ